jgi:hypothetical protein
MARRNSGHDVKGERVRKGDNEKRKGRKGLLLKNFKSDRDIFLKDVWFVLNLKPFLIGGKFVRALLVIQRVISISDHQLILLACHWQGDDERFMVDEMMRRDKVVHCLTAESGGGGYDLEFGVIVHLDALIYTLSSCSLAP